MNEFHYSGEWWLPHNPDASFFGTLTFSAEKGGLLELFGGMIQTDFMDRVQVIHGITNVGKITLCNIISGGSTFRSESLSTFRYHIGYILQDYHFNKFDDILFSKVMVGLSELPNWLMSYTGIDRAYGRQAPLIEFSYQFPQEVKYKVEDLTVEFSFGYTTKGTESWREFRFQEFTKVVVTPSEQKSLSEYLDYYVWQLLCFIEFGADTANNIQSLTGYVMEDGKEIRVPIFSRFQERTSLNNISITEDMLFTLADIKEEFQTYFGKWLKLLDKLKPVYELYLTATHERQYGYIAFLLLAQAIEVFHRRIYGGVYMSEDEYYPIKEQLIAAIPQNLEEGHKQSLEGTLKYGFEYSLRSRLKRVLSENLKEFAEILPFIKEKSERNSFIGVIVDTRNYHTHYSSEQRPDVDYSSYFWQLKIILIILFLRELGMPDEKIIALCKRNRNINYWHGKGL